VSGFCSGQPYSEADQIAIRQRCRKDTFFPNLDWRRLLWMQLAPGIQTKKAEYDT
jgi:hypothetical protein